MSTTKPVSIRQCFAEVPDPRREHMRLHNLWDIIAITILAVIAGADSWVEVANYGVSKLDWLGTFLELPNGIPAHDTFNRVFALLNPTALQEGFLNWVETIAPNHSGPAGRHRWQDREAFLRQGRWQRRFASGQRLGQRKSLAARTTGGRRQIE